MEGLGSSMLWCYQESIHELRQKLQDTLSELEAFKMEANKLSAKHKEETKNLLNLLKAAYQERDQAKDQLTRILKNLTPARANSSITESNSLSQSHGSSPLMDSFLDPVSSPEFSSHHQVGFDNQELFFRDCDDPTAKVDPSDAVIKDLAKGKTLPPRGNLLEAVMEAGPLLQNLLVAGALPQWRNPPPPQCLGIPPVSFRGFDAASNSMPCLAIPRGFNPQMCSASMFEFGRNCVSGINTRIPAGKRPRQQ